MVAAVQMIQHQVVAEVDNFLVAMLGDDSCWERVAEQRERLGEKRQPVIGAVAV